MKIHGIVLSLAAGVLLSTAALAQQTSDRGDPLRTPGAAQRMAPMELQPQTSLREFPSGIFFPTDTFNGGQIQNLERAGIGNVGQLVQADPPRLGRMLGMNPREVEAAQQDLKASLR